MKIAVIGHSHISCMQKAAGVHDDRPIDGAHYAFLQLREVEQAKPVPAPAPRPLLQRLLDKALKKRPPAPAPSGAMQVAPEALSEGVATAIEGAEWVVFCVTGNQHNLQGLVNHPQRAAGADPSVMGEEERLAFGRLLARHTRWLDTLTPACAGRKAVLFPPPPIESEAWIRKHGGAFRKKIEELGVGPAAYRLHLWQEQCRFIRADAERRGLPIIELPDDIFSPGGFLREEYRSTDATHGNEAYGERLLHHLAAWAYSAGAAPSPVPPPTSPLPAQADHPYRNRPDYTYWKQAVVQVATGALDPVVAPPFLVGPEERIATAGSCFAQHISRRLQAGGFRFLRMEEDAVGAPPYEFSARYGNVYTTRQLRQLFERAFGRFEPQEQVWEMAGGRYCDPFRPRIRPGGFASATEVQADAVAHLAAVRRMFETLDLFIYTLGLTECWSARADGAVYPLAPGVAGGRYDPARQEFRNLTVDEVVEDLNAFITQLRQVNPGARVILTLSPVPLAATYEEEHVLVSTSYSKAVLRVAAETIRRTHPGLYYFPSYEIITAGDHFGPDRRSVTEAGVDHVMRVFMARLTQGGGEAGVQGSSGAPASAAHWAEMEALAEVDCDEALLVK